MSYLEFLPWFSRTMRPAMYIEVYVLRTSDEDLQIIKV